VTVPATGDFLHAWPRFLPHGRHFLYLALGEESRHAVGNLDGSTRTIRRFPAQSQGSGIDYAEPGVVLFRDRDALMAQPFDTDALALSGEAVQIAEGLSSDGPGRSFFAVSSAGALVYGIADRVRDARLTWFDRTGKALGALGDEAPHGRIALSPNGRLVASLVHRRTMTDNAIILYDVGDGSARELTSGDVHAPVWSPDGTALAYAAARTSPPNLYTREIGSAVERHVLPSRLEDYPSGWTTDGKLVYTQLVGDHPSVNVIPADAAGPPVRLSAESSRERLGQVSPDGRWIAAVTEVSGVRRIVITSFPVAGPRWSLPGTLGVPPTWWELSWFQWSPDGRELLFIDTAGDLVSVPVAVGQAVTLGSPQRLFRMPRGARDFAVSRDGRRLLVIVPTSDPKPEPLRVVVNWMPGG
jgi:hypothetical protein